MFRRGTKADVAEGILDVLEGKRTARITGHGNDNKGDVTLQNGLPQMGGGPN